MGSRLLVVFVLAVFVVVPHVAHAAPVGNIAKPAMLSGFYTSEHYEDAQVGVIFESENDIVFDRNIEDQLTDTEFTWVGGKIDAVFRNKYIIYGLLGGATYEEEFSDAGSIVKVESVTDLGWGIGATVVAYETELIILDNAILRLGVDGRYRDVDLGIDKIIVDGTTYALPSNSVIDDNLEVSEWQVAFEASLQWGKFSPYTGVKYSDLDATTRMTVDGTTYEDSSIDPDDKVGIFVGLDILTADSISLNVEGRFIDEEALTFGGTLKF